ncbi:MAG TPA: hypothetical protein EYO73_11910, partial [Sulfurimonas sp.]|nr:hypothetical protein [Sulfurimonas sp.]
MMKKVLLLLIITFVAQAKMYEGCGITKKDALIELSGTINSSVSNSFTVNIEETNENFSKQVSAKSHVSTNLDLVDITFKTSTNNTKDKYCANVTSKDQIKHAQKSYQSIRNYSLALAPSNETDKINTLGKWIEKIDKTLNLINVFSDALSDEDKSNILKQHKLFIDVRTKLILKHKDAIWKACGKNKSEAYTALNNMIFSKKGEGSFWSKIIDFTKEDTREVVSNDISYIKNKDKTCAVLEKTKLLRKVLFLYEAVTEFSQKKLPEDELQKYTNINEWLNDISKLQELMVLFPKKFTKVEHKVLVDKRASLKKYQATLIPQ